MPHFWNCIHAMGTSFALPDVDRIFEHEPVFCIVSVLAPSIPGAYAVGGSPSRSRQDDPRRFSRGEFLDRCLTSDYCIRTCDRVNIVHALC
jgi:hypothetical protein